MILVVAMSGFVLIGAFGITRYIWTFWLYRGYPPPSGPSTVVIAAGTTRKTVAVRPGVVEHITVRSSALGGQIVPVLVYLPPGYAADTSTRYPVFYLLHGFPGSPSQFIDVGDVATLSNTLTAERHIGPMILVMPSGSSGFFLDTEWANSLRPDSDWETFIAHDLVDAIDARYRTIRTASARAIGGLSEGAYGALNIAFHHVREFGVVEAWSPYYEADMNPVFFGREQGLLAYNSPRVELDKVAPQLRANHTYIWIYCGAHDFSNKGSKTFAAELTALRVEHHFSVQPGHHNWSLWRRMMPTSLEVAWEHLSHAEPRA